MAEMHPPENRHSANGRPSVAGAFSDTFAPLRNRNLSIYLAGQGISLCGTFMQAAAQSWTVWQLSHSVRDLGLVAMLESLPLLLFGALAGTIADRVDRRRLLLGTQTAAMLLAFVFAFLVQCQLIQLWHVFLLAFGLGCVSALDLPAQNAFIGDLSGLDQVRQAVALDNMVLQASRMVGPTVAGWVMGALGIAPAFWINGASFLAVIGTLLAVRARRGVQPQGQQQDDFLEGIRYVGTQARIQDLLLLSGLLTFFLFTIGQLLPPIATDRLQGGPETLGLLLGATGAGATVSLFVVVPVVLQARRVGLTLAGVVIWAGLWVVVLSASNWLGLSMAAGFLCSLAVPVVMTSANGIIQMLAPPHMRARLLVLWIMVTFGLQPIAALLVGFSGQILGAPLAILINGLALVFGTVLLLAIHPDLGRWRLAPQGDPVSAARPTAQQAEGTSPQYR